MDRNTAKILLENLLARIIVDGETGQGNLTGVLTPLELEALKQAAAVLGHISQQPEQVSLEEEMLVEPEDEIAGDQDEKSDILDDVEFEDANDEFDIDDDEDAISLDDLPEEDDLFDGLLELEEAEPASSPDPPQAPVKIELNLASLQYSAPQDEKIRMCLDFGTAMSKAFASMVDEDELYETYPLKLGSRASGGKSAQIYPVPSSLWIGNEGKVYVGGRAIVLSLQADPDLKRQRFDSLKKELILGLKESSPFEQPMNKALNPTGVPFSTGEAITYYLGYFIDLACTELEETHGFSRYVERNYALPSWPPERRSWGEKC